MIPRIHIIPVLRDNYAYIVEGENKGALIIDPGQVQPVDAFIQQHGLNPVLILNTHHHADHVAGNAELKAKYNIPVIAPRAELKLIPHATKGVEQGETIEQSGIMLDVIETPGHTNGHVVFYCKAANALFSGDTLFSMGCGRLLEGTAEDLFASLQILKYLPPDTQLYCGHEYTQANGNFALSVYPDNADLANRMKDVARLRANNLPTIPVTLETELKTNPFLRADSAKNFAELRLRKDNF